MWRYLRASSCTEGFPSQRRRRTPLVASRKLAAKVGPGKSLFQERRRLLPSLSFKDRVVATALVARAGSISRPSAVPLRQSCQRRRRARRAAGIRRMPSSSPPISSRQKFSNTAVYGARIVRINGNYDHVNRLCAQIADRFQWGLVNVNLALIIPKARKRTATKSPSSSVGRFRTTSWFRWPAVRSSQKIAKAFRELVTLGWVEAKPVSFSARKPPVFTHLGRREAQSPAL